MTRAFLRLVLFGVELFDEIGLTCRQLFRELPRGARLFVELVRACALELSQGTLDLRARVQQVLSCVLPRFTLDVALSFADVSLSFHDFLRSALRVLDESRELLFALLQLGLVLLQPLEERGDVTLRGRHTLLRARNDGLGQLELARDADTVRSARDALHKEVRRLETFRIELQRRVHDARKLCRELLECPKMRRGKRRG